jgi:transcriptional regulator with PAS, ATPase and Fis domain
VGRFAEAVTTRECTVYTLNDLSDMKKTLNELEEAYQRKAEQVIETDRRLRAQTEAGFALIGNSKAMQRVRELAERIALSPATVLIEGETGTGKEMAARLIHALSPRSEHSFIKVDCSTLPATLLESLLFGHEKGAFTGADAMRRGLFEQAENGTLFIDEAGNLSREAQAKLLQFLQHRTITRLGSEKSLAMNVRILVASNIPLQSLVQKGLFREDLYHRMAVLMILLPPLRERMEDIPVLAQYFLQEFNRTYARNLRGLSPDVYRSLNEHNWPGNVRELRNALERAYHFSQTDEIKEIVLVDEAQKPEGLAGNRVRKKRANLRFLDEKPEEILQAISRNRGNMKAAAKELDVSVRALYYFLRKRNVSPNAARRNPRAK